MHFRERQAAHKCPQSVGRSQISTSNTHSGFPGVTKRCPVFAGSTGAPKLEKSPKSLIFDRLDRWLGSTNPSTTVSGPEGLLCSKQIHEYSSEPPVAELRLDRASGTFCAFLKVLTRDGTRL